MKEYNGEFKNQELSSGSMVWSGKSAPIPQVREGIPEFVNIPLTNGWLQIKGDLSYGKFIDNKFLKDNFSYKNGQITTDDWYHQKQFFLRSKESKPFVVTIGAELAAQFCGDYSIYKDGVMTHNEKNKHSFMAFYKVFYLHYASECDNCTS